MIILGISAYYHDSAAALIVDGEIVAAAQEERFTRVKHDAGFPANAVRSCLSTRNLTPADVDFVAFYDKPLLKFERLLETYVDHAPRGFASFLKAMPVWLKQKLWFPDLLRTELGRLMGPTAEKEARRAGETLRLELLFADHHESHAASAFYPSPFHEAAVLTMDGVGEWATSSIGVGRGNELTLLRQLRYPHSLGLLYSAFTYYTGFRVNSGEYKVMGLAPYGEPTYVQAIRDHVVDIADDGSIRVNQEYFDYSVGSRMTNARFDRLFGGPAREPESALTQRELDLARSIQEVTEEVMLKMARFAAQETGLDRLCLAGGVALNCVGNGRILNDGTFRDVWIQPAAGDAGGALGAALAVWHRYLGNPRPNPESTSGEPARDQMNGAYLGPRDSDAEIERFLAAKNAPYRKVKPEELPEIVAGLLAEGKVIGLHQGRMEFGPRALGARSIIGDARSPTMQSRMNLKIKFRESFRPFAPAVLAEYVSEWFDLRGPSPYMLLVATVKEARRRPVTDEDAKKWGIDKLQVVRSEIPAVTHVDDSARVQTIHRETNPVFWEIVEAFRRKTGCPVIVNTSFNVRGEPIVCTPEDSYRCFMRTEMDVLILETCVLIREEQPPFVDARNAILPAALD
jgi:carbamoyltransferase